MKGLFPVGHKKKEKTVSRVAADRLALQEGAGMSFLKKV